MKAKFYCSVKYVSVMLAILLALTMFTGSWAAEASVSRIGGVDRYETSALLAGNAFETAETVIIARGDEGGQFADGLASSVLAGALNSPVLLTAPDSLPLSVKKVITDLGATRALVLGGTGAVKETVAIELENLGLSVTRIGGSDRYETAAKVAEEAKKHGSLAAYAFLVNGSATADSLVAAPAAFKNKAPILLVTEKTIPTATKKALASLEIGEVYVVGGTAVVEKAVVDALSGLAVLKKRLGGLTAMPPAWKWLKSSSPTRQT